MKSLKKTDFNFVEIKKSDWPPVYNRLTIVPFLIHKSKSFLVQHFQEKNGFIRISINRTEHDNGIWNDKISWDDLQAIKNAVGYFDFDALEIYPAQKDVVNVANLRHLWVSPTELNITWRK